MIFSVLGKLIPDASVLIERELFSVTYMWSFICRK